MIEFGYMSDNEIVNEPLYKDWLLRIISSENKLTGDLVFVFCDDNYLLSINQKYLNHNTYTDIITFDYTNGDTLSGDVFISVDRVKENAMKFEISFEEELRRVMSHGILHLAGYGDKKDEEIKAMRLKEEEKMKMFHVEQD
jgi:rRNA maturation RNase YbeY